VDDNVILAHLIHCLKARNERTLAKPWCLKVILPEQVCVAKHELHTVPAVVAHRAADRASGSNDVAHNLDVKAPIERIVEHEDGSDGHLGKVCYLVVGKKRA
jgi:hypothetical protein